MALFDRIVIAGVGLIGGSLGLAVRARGLAREVLGFGRGEENLRTAVERGAVDRYERDPATVAHDADLLVLAVPVGSLAAVTRMLLPHSKPNAVVIDVGSVKADVVEALEAIVIAPAAFVGCHPIAGTENSGAAYADASLLEGRRCILTPTNRTDGEALARVRNLWEAVGMRVETMGAATHDRLLALVSHLPHVVAYSLIAALEGVRIDGRDPLEYSGGGLRDTTRIASSHSEMWKDIFLANRRETLRAIDDFEASLRALRERVEQGDAEGLRSDLERIRVARERLRSL